MLLADPADGAHRGPPQPHANLVLGVDREVLRHADASASAERQVAQVVVLGQVFRRLVGNGRRRDRGAADGQPADLARRRHVALDEQRRHPQGVRDVVEAVGGIVRGQRADVGIDAQQIAHRVAVLRAVHPVQQRATRVGARERGRIERRLQPRREGVVRGPRRPRATRRGHGAATQLLDDLLPQLGVGGDVLRGNLDRVQSKAGGPQPAVVAGHAIALHERRVVVGCRRGGCGADGSRRLHQGRWRGSHGGLRRLGRSDAGQQTSGQQTAGQPRQPGVSQ